MGASSMARVRPLSSAAAWWSRSSGVPSPSGAIAMTDRVRPGSPAQGRPGRRGSTQRHGLVGGRSPGRRDNDPVRSTQFASQERCPAGPSCGRRSNSGLRVWAEFRWLPSKVSGRYSGCRWDQVLVPHVRRLPSSRSVPFPAPQRARVRSRIQARRCQPAGERALWHGARPPSPAWVIQPGRH
jgi:hypothetical protein